MDEPFFDPSLQLANPVYVTRPWLPPIEDYMRMLEPLWESRVLTNGGEYVHAFECALAEYECVPHCRVLCNGTSALMGALAAKKIRGDVLVTPFTFVATSEALHWTGSRPVFCDIEPGGWNIDPTTVEARITPSTEAILGVHLFGFPCQLERLQGIASKHGLALIYDAAHAIGCRYRGRPLASFGDASVVSFHATKPLTTLEGGAVFTSDAHVARCVERFRAFGFDEAGEAVMPGMNAKMNEFQAALGLLEIQGVEEELRGRRRVFAAYLEGLRDVPGLEMTVPSADLQVNHSYVPVRVKSIEFGATRDELHAALKAHQIHAKPYFTPLSSGLPWYKTLPTADPRVLPVAVEAAETTICLPVYGELPDEVVERIVLLIRRFHQSRVGSDSISD